jgi:hypothetical protein
MDRGLLVALLALQNQFILPPQFLVGFQTWLANRSLSLDEILVQHAYITKSQRESLTLTLIAILEKSHNNWQTAVAEYKAIGMVYRDMLALAEKDATVLEWVKQIQVAFPNVSLPVDAGRQMSADKDPYGTIDFDTEFGPYATLSGEENQTEKGI